MGFSLMSPSTRSPQDCVLLPLLLILYINDCHSQRHILKSTDEPVILYLLSSDDPDHGPVARVITDWCESSFLKIIDFKKDSTVTLPVVISDENVEVMNQYKYLGTVLDDIYFYRMPSIGKGPAQ